MIDREMMEKAVNQCDLQIKAVIAVVASGRAAGGNAIEFNNLLKCKQNLEELLAAQPSKKK